MAGITVTRRGFADARSSSALTSRSVWVSVAQEPYSVTPSSPDAGPGINKAITTVSAAGGGVVFIPAGTYTVLTTIVMATGVVLLGAGREATILNCAAVAGGADGTGSHYFGIYCAGSVGSRAFISTDAKRGEQQVQMASTAGINPGDLFVLATDPPQGVLVTTVASGDTTVVVDQTANPHGDVASDWDALGELLIDNERIAYTAASVSRGGGAGGVDRWTFTVRATPSAAFGRGNGGSTAAGHTAGARAYQYNTARAWWWVTSPRTPIARGEIKRVASVTAAAVVFDDAIYDDYPVASQASLRKVTPIRDFAVEGLTVTGSSDFTRTSEWGIYAAYADHFRIERTHTVNWSSVHVEGNMVTRPTITKNTFYGKAQGGNASAPTCYAVALYNACQWGTVTENQATRCNKIFTSSANTQGQGWWGVPRHVTVTANTLDNSSLPYYTMRHAGIEIHGGGEHITVTANTIDGADSGVSIQSGRHIVVTGNTIRNWFRAGIYATDTVTWADIDIGPNDIGPRAYGPGRTTVVSDDGATNLVLADMTGFVDVAGSTGANLLLAVDNELIKYTGYAGTPGAYTLNGIVRGFLHSTTATHSPGADVRPFGSASACPVDIDLSNITYVQSAYNCPLTRLTANALIGDTTLTVASTTGFPAAPNLAVIEGEDATTNFQVEVVAYTGLTGTTLTGVTRGLFGSNQVAHTAGVFVLPYAPAVQKVRIADNIASTDLDYYGVVVRGFGPTHQTVMQGNELTNVSWSRLGGYRPQTEGALIQRSNVYVEDNKLRGWALAFRSQGNRVTFSDRNVAVYDYQDTVSGGYGYRISGNDTRVLNSESRLLYRPVLIDAGVTGARVLGNIFETPDRTTHGVSDSGTGSVVTGNYYILPGGDSADLIRWGAANGQTTVGAAGAASALPATPSRYLKVVGDDGNTYVVAAYLPS